MKITTAKLGGIALAALLMTSADARADLIHWSYGVFGRTRRAASCLARVPSPSAMKV